MAAVPLTTPQTTVNLATRLRRLRRLARFMDSSWGIPGTRFRFGGDALLGLIPVAGDALGAVISLWFVVEAGRLGAPKGVMARMVGTIAIDALVGSIPVLGDVFDVGWRANTRNIKRLEAHFATEAPEHPAASA